MILNLRQRMFPPPGDSDNIAVWRVRLLDGLLSVTLLAGLAAAVPSIVLAISERLWPIVIADVVGLVWIGALWYRQDLQYGLRLAQYLAIAYGLGLVLLLNIGQPSQIYLMAVPILAVLLLSLRAAVWALLLNTATLILVGYVANAENGLGALNVTSFTGWLVIGINYLAVATMLTLSCAFLIRSFESVLHKQREHARNLAHQAQHDPLTGLPNRGLLADRLQQAMLQSHRRKQSLAVAYLDIDGFKAVNDTHGHGFGDELLIAIAQRLKAAMRDGDTLARFGGDEFVAVLVDLEPATEGHAVLQRLLKAAADPIWVGEKVMQVSASIGVTFSPQDGSDADLLIRHADQAMYVAKHAGKNRYVLFDVAHDTALQNQRESLEHIRNALKNKEFVLFYQPKVNMKTGQVMGAEALIRWQHPQQGLLAPAAFLPVIEDHSISIDVGEWVINTALAQMSAWRARGLDLPVSVNIGARQLQQDGFAVRLGEMLAAHPDVPPHHLQLEVLETSALEDIDRVGAAMSACQAIGVSFALDDFGTGYSSLTYLKRLPAEILKIDRSFVRDMLVDSGDLAIVNGVIGLSTAFGRQVIAEGVETEAHGNLLLSIGCELAQGYGIARPIPAQDLADWVAKWHVGAIWTA